MKKMFLATCLLAASVFAAPQAADTTKAPEAKAEATAAPKAETTTEAPKAEAAVAPKAEAAVAPKAEAAEAPKAEAAVAPKAEAAEAPKAEAAEAPKAEAAEAPKAEAAEAPKAEAAEAPKAEAAEAPKAEVQTAKTEKKHAKKIRRKKKKLIENAIFQTAKLDFDILADFELEAGKVFWATEEDEMSDNFETWTGEANFAVLAEGEDFKGKIGIAFYPGDLKMVDEKNTDKITKKTALREEDNNSVDDYFSLDEAWAMQNTDYFVFKVGRWDNTDKNGDYFGGYVDGYLTGFMSTQKSENQLQFGFTPSDNLDLFLSFISNAPNLNKGDIRAAISFHGLEKFHEVSLQLAYRSNLFDKVYDNNVDVSHNFSLKAKLPLMGNRFNIFAETAFMNIDPNDDMVVPVTGGVSIITPVVDRIILEAEYVKDRGDHQDFQSFATKHVKDVLGAIYIEKAFTDRFSLSAGLHSYGSSKDVMLSGNLVGRIN